MAFTGYVDLSDSEAVLCLEDEKHAPMAHGT